MNKQNKGKESFFERHPKLNILFGVLLLIVLLGITILLVYSVVKYTGVLLKELAKLVAVVIVALITGGVSIIGVVLSSIVGKSLEYKKSRNEYLAQKREEPYGAFVDMVYKVQQSSKSKETYTQEQMLKDISSFSKQLTLWGSPKVAKKWNEFRLNGANPQKATENLFLMEEIMNQMRRDLGVKKVKKGELLGFFVNDVKDYID